MPENFELMLQALRVAKEALLELADSVGETEPFNEMFNEGGVAFEAFMKVSDTLSLVEVQ